MTKKSKYSNVKNVCPAQPSPAQPMTICSPVPGNSLVTLHCSLGVIGTL